MRNASRHSSASVYSRTKRSGFSRAELELLLISFTHSKLRKNNRLPTPPLYHPLVVYSLVNKLAGYRKPLRLPVAAATTWFRVPAILLRVSAYIMQRAIVASAFQVIEST